MPNHLSQRNFLTGTAARTRLAGGCWRPRRIRFSNQRFKGYGVLEARPDELLVHYRAVESTQTPRSRAFTLASFRVASGTPRVEVLDQPAGPRPLPQIGTRSARSRRRRRRRRAR